MDKQTREMRIEKILERLSNSIKKTDNDTLLFLNKFEWEKLDVLVDKWLGYYYKKQNKFGNEEEYRKYLIIQIEKFVDVTKKLIINKNWDRFTYQWLMTFEKEYHELLYDWENDPIAKQLENDKKLEKKDWVKNLISSVSKTLYSLFDRK